MLNAELQKEFDELKGEIDVRINRVEAISKSLNWVEPDMIWTGVGYDHLCLNLGEILENDMREILRFYTG